MTDNILDIFLVVNSRNSCKGFNSISGKIPTEIAQREASTWYWHQGGELILELIIQNCIKRGAQILDFWEESQVEAF